MPITAHLVILGFAVFFYKQKKFSFSSSLLLSVSIITFITYLNKDKWDNLSVLVHSIDSFLKNFTNNSS